MKRYPYDFFALKGIDIERWNAEFHWPITPTLSRRITHDILAKWSNIVMSLGDSFAGDCLLIALQLPTSIQWVIYNFVAIQMLSQEGYQIIHSDKVVVAPLLQRARDEAISLPRENLWRLREGHGRAYDLQRLGMDTIANLRRAGAETLLSLLRGETIHSFPENYVQSRPSFLDQKGFVHLISPRQWLVPALAKPASNEDSRIFRDVAETLSRFVSHYTLELFGIPLLDSIISAISSYIEASLHHIAEVYSALQAHAKIIRPRHILSSTGGKTFTRALCLAARRNGAKTTGYPHGYYIGHSLDPIKACHEFATVDEFMAYTPGSAALIERYCTIHPPLRNPHFKVRNDNMPFFKNIYDECSHLPSSRNIERVMVLELILQVERTGYATGYNSLLLYNFYYTLCRSLVRNGYKVVFKKRPKSLGWGGIDPFAGIPGIRLLQNGPFESRECLDQADAFFVQYAMSSTFHYAMCTEKALVYIDAAWENWFDETKSSMRKRCRVLPCSYDPKGRQVFAETDLLASLEPGAGPRDTEYLERYLFPR